MTKDIIKVGTFFSGIGAPEKALQRLKEENIIKDYKLEFFSEIDKDAIKSFCAVHNVDSSLNLGDIKKVKGKQLPYCDLWVGGFPCQDISCAGKMKGFDSNSSTRSSLGWEMIRLLNEVKEKPKYVIFENVYNITSKAFEGTLKLFKSDLEDLGYKLHEKVLSAVDFKIPQTRKRYFLVAILNNEKEFTFPEPLESNLILKDFLEEDVDEKYYLTTDEYEVAGDKLIFHHKTKKEKIYEVDIEKYKKGGVCGIDKNCKFAMSSRVFSELGNAPTLTANNTADNVKVLVEGDK